MQRERVEVGPKKVETTAVAKRLARLEAVKCLFMWETKAD
jgi:hypothetical protein